MNLPKFPKSVKKVPFYFVVDEGCPTIEYITWLYAGRNLLKRQITGYQELERQQKKLLRYHKIDGEFSGQK